MTRKEFLNATVALAAASAASSARAQAAAPGADAKAPCTTPRNRNPYKGVDWATAQQIRGTTHVHCKTQEDLETILKRIEFITLSNYYPSAPWWPLAKMTENYYRVHHDFPVMVNDKRVEGPFDWNKIVGQWIKELPAELQAEYPFKEGGKIFKPLPEGILEAPNAEHHAFRYENGHGIPCLHMNAPGSTFASGTFDQWQKRRFQTGVRGGYNFGSGELWSTAIDRMIAGLIYPDGGGVTINHPVWSSYDRMFLLKLLDHDPRVLGMEVIEGGAGNGERYWDWVLATGRQCFGFFVPDHSIRRKDGSQRPGLPEGLPGRKLLRREARPPRTELHAHFLPRNDGGGRNRQAGPLRGDHGPGRREDRGEGDRRQVDDGRGVFLQRAAQQGAHLRAHQGVRPGRLGRGALLTTLHARVELAKWRA